MLELLLVRHGETDWNRERRCQGATDVPLNATGRAQAEAAAAWLAEPRLTAVWSSDLQRARETAACIAAPHGLAVTAHAGLREMHEGDLEGLRQDELLERYPALMLQWRDDPANLQLPGGESLRQVQDRAWAALEDLMAAHPHGRVVCVSHNLTIRCILSRILRLDLKECRRFALDTAGITRIDVNGPRPGMVVRSLNITHHVDVPAVESRD